MPHPCRRAALALLAATVACRHAAPAPAPASPVAATAAPVVVTHPDDAPATPPAKPDSVTRRGYTLADVRFMRQMIGHHAQALVMAALVPAHSARDDMKLLSERITVSQRDEIRMMQRWLRERGERVPDAAMPMAADHDMSHDMGHDMGTMPMDDATTMPGMLTAAGLDSLRAAQGPRFDRLFLRDMIRHHEGALVMAKALLDAPGAAQEPEIFRFASDVDADQRAEIRRMEALLRTLPDE